MGDVFFISNYIPKGLTSMGPIRRDLVIRSEDLGKIIDYGIQDSLHRDRGNLQRTINSTFGIFFYESNLWDKKTLKKELYKLIDEALKKYSAEPLL